MNAYDALSRTVAETVTVRADLARLLSGWSAADLRAVAEGHPIGPEFPPILESIPIDGGTEYRVDDVLFYASVERKVLGMPPIEPPF